jgi:hypothetical protein
VKAWLERERDGRSIKRRPRATDAYLPLIRAKVAATQGKIKSKPLLRVLRAAGYTAACALCSVRCSRHARSGRVNTGAFIGLGERAR